MLLTFESICSLALPVGTEEAGAGIGTDGLDKDAEASAAAASIFNVRNPGYQPSRYRHFPPEPAQALS